MTRVRVHVVDEDEQDTVLEDQKRSAKIRYDIVVVFLRRNWRIIAEGVCVMSLVTVAILLAQSSRQKEQLQAKLNYVTANPQKLIEDQNSELLKIISSTVELPRTETPTIVTISDAEKLKQKSSFFADSENGDKLIQYAKAGLIIIYRPSLKKVINAGSIPKTSQADKTTSTQLPMR